MVTVLATPLVARAMDPAEVAEELQAARLFVEEGAADVNRIQLTQAITDARRIGVDLRIAVVAGGDAQLIADETSAILAEGTVLIFAAGAYGIAGTELDPRRLERALDGSVAALAAGPPETAAQAFVDSLDPVDGGRSLTVIGAGLVVVILLVAIGGYVFEERANAGEPTDRLEEHRSALTEQSRDLASRVLDTADRAVVAARADISAAYQEASAAFARAQSAINEADSKKALDAAARDLAAAEAAYARVRQLLG
ncbi:MAG: hypothetical protein OEM97_09100 [Acidimicrobiia bacterium]|nr:hypothetical protein [Acidimicrobiia bacterium]